MLIHRRSLLPALAVAGVALCGAPAAHAASSTLNVGADLVLIPPVLQTLPPTKCPKVADVQVNGRRVGYLPTTSNVYGTCPIRGTITVPYAPGTTVLYTATGAGVWPVIALRRTVAAPVVVNN